MFIQLVFHVGYFGCIRSTTAAHLVEASKNGQGNGQGWQPEALAPVRKVGDIDARVDPSCSSVLLLHDPSL